MKININLVSLLFIDINFQLSLGMKRLTLLLGILFFVNFTFSQTWNQGGGIISNNPLTDNVGIGLNNPNNLLQVKDYIEFHPTNFGLFVGYQTGANNTANYNTFIGYQAGKATTTGKQNLFIGYLAGTTNTTGKNNVFIGEGAGFLNTIGASNTFIGRRAGEYNTGDANTFVGKECGRNNTTGSNNTGFGTQALKINQTGLGNTVFGNNALINAVNPDSNTVFGYSAMGTAGTCSRNVALGFEAGNLASNVQECVLLGFQTGYNNTTSNRLMIDNSNTNTPLIDGNFTTNTLTINSILGLAVGTTINEFSIDGTLADNSDDALVTEKAIKTYVDGTIAGSANWETTGNFVYPSTITDSLGVGTNSPNNLFQVKNLIEFNPTTSGTFIGDSAGANNTAILNTFIGCKAGKANSSGKQNVFIGYLAGSTNTSGKNNVFIGESAGLLNTSGASNTFLGRKAGENNSTGFANTFFGKEAGRYNTIGTNNTAYGTQALKGSVTGSFNIAFGNNALQYSQNADSNLVMGFGVFGAYDNTYRRNVVLGHEAASLAGSIDGCVIIGNMVGRTNSTSNRLMIDNENTVTPLLDGNFTNNVLTINDVLKLTPRSSAPSSPTKGMMYFDSNDDKLKVYDGVAWQACY